MLVSNSVASIKKMLQSSNAVSFLTPIDIIAEVRTESLMIKPVQDRVTLVDRLALMMNHSSGGSPAVGRFANELVSRIDAFRSTFSEEKQ
jgi:hypothetical protein